MQSPKITEAKALDDYKLLLTFANGEVKEFNVKPYLDYPVFRPLKDNSQFGMIKIEDGTVEWDCGADLSPDTFYLESVERESLAKQEM